MGAALSSNANSLSSRSRSPQSVLLPATSTILLDSWFSNPSAKLWPETEFRTPSLGEGQRQVSAFIRFQTGSGSVINITENENNIDRILQHYNQNCTPLQSYVPIYQSRLLLYCQPTVTKMETWEVRIHSCTSNFSRQDFEPQFWLRQPVREEQRLAGQLKYHVRW